MVINLQEEIIFPTSLDYMVKGENPMLRIYGRTKEGERVIRYLVDRNPYFFVRTDEFVNFMNEHDIDDMQEIISVDDSFVDKDGIKKPFISIDGYNTVKITARKPSDVSGQNEKLTYLKDYFEYTYEADVRYEDRQRVDLDLCNYISVPKEKMMVKTIDIKYPDLNEIPRIRTMIFDIENMDNKTIKQAKNGESEIVSIVIYDYFTNKYNIFTSLKLDDFAKIIVKQKLREYWEDHETYSHMKDAELEYFISANEHEFLANVIKFIKENYPDAMAGWNSNDYDWNVFYERCRNIGLEESLKQLSQTGMVRKTWKDVKINGMLTLDLMDMYDKLQQKTLKFKSLNKISEDELNTKKLPRTSIIEMVQTDIPHLIAYNVIDVQLTKLINDKADIINFYTMLSMKAHCEIGTTSNSQFIDKLILHQLKDIYVLPSRASHKTERNEGNSRFGGGAVHDATAGLHKHVIVVDFSSLYPSIMRSLNISIETRITDQEFAEILRKIKADLTDEELSNVNQLIADGLVPENINIAANGVKFKCDEMGIVPTILEDLTNERAEEKKLMKAATDPKVIQEHNLKQLAIKILSNAFFGVLGWDGFRLANIDTASAITTTGQFLSFNTREFVEGLGFVVIYGDTDSLFIELEGEHDYESMKTICENLCEKINDNLTKVAKKYFNADEHYLDIAFDKAFSVLFQVGKKGGGAAKKRYAGYQYDDDGNLHFKAMGFELKRADKAEITQEVQKKLLDLILQETPIEDVCEYMRELKSDFMNGRIPMNKLALRYNIKKPLVEMHNSPFKRGAMNANNPLVLNRHYDGGDMAMFYQIARVPKGVPNITELCIDIDENIPEGFEIDYKGSWKKLIEAPMEMVLESYGITYDYIEHGKSEDELNEFFDVSEDVEVIDAVKTSSDEIEYIKILNNESNQRNDVSEGMLNNFQTQMKESKKETKKETDLGSFF